MGKVNVTTYDPKKVNVIVGGRVITGFASDGVVTLAKSEDSVTPSVGAKGDVTYSENANESGTVSLTLMSTSSSLSYLRDLEAQAPRRQRLHHGCQRRHRLHHERGQLPHHQDA